MRNGNGLKRWLVSLGTALLLGYVAWLGQSVVALARAGAAQEARQQVIERWLERIEQKVDRLLQPRPGGQP